MRRALPLAAAVLARVMTTGSVIAADEAADDDSRKGPFVVTDRTLGSLLDDGWTVVTADGRWTAQVEHTVLVTADGIEVLTARPDAAQGKRTRAR